MDARVVQELAPDRFILGYGTSKIFLNNALMQTRRRSGRCATRSPSCAACSPATSSLRRRDVERRRPRLQDEADAPRDVPPVYVAATAPKMQALAGEIADGCLTPSITTPAFVRYTRENVRRRHRHRLHRRRLHRPRPRRGAGRCTRDRRHVSREQGAEHPAAPPTRCSSSRAWTRTRSARSPRRWSREDGLRRRREVSDAILDKCKPIAGTPADCIAAIEEYRDAGARTSCSSSGATSGTSRSSCSARKSCRISDDRRATASSSWRSGSSPSRP